MSLKSSIIRASRTAFRAMDSVGVPITYNVTGEINYDVASGVSVRDVLATYNIEKAWFTSYKLADIDGEMIQSKDRRLTIQATDVTFDVTLADNVIDEDGNVWEVIDIKLPPPGIVYILQVRGP